LQEGIGMQKKRNWKEYNEKFVRRGKLYIFLDFLENWDEELNRRNEARLVDLSSFLKPLCIF